MNVIGHEHVTSNADAKVSCASAVSDETRVGTAGIGEQVCTSVSIECYEVDRCVGALKEQIQSRRLILEHAAHGKRCSGQSSQRTSPGILGCSVRCPQRSREQTMSAKFRRGQRTLQPQPEVSARDSGRYSAQSIDNHVSIPVSSRPK